MKKDKGMTLIELIIYIALLSVFLNFTVASLFLIAQHNASTYSNAFKE